MTGGKTALKDILSTIYNIASDKKASGIIILDIGKLTSFSDYFFICSAESTVQVNAIADGIVKSLKEKNIKLWHDEGYKECNWILLDYGQVIIHIFLEEVRDFYNLEGLWADAPRVK